MGRETHLVPVIWEEEQEDFAKGQMGSAQMGSLQFLLSFFDRNFLGTPVNLLLSSQKCQGVPPIYQNSYFCSGPISVNPLCPRPRIGKRSTGGPSWPPRPAGWSTSGTHMKAEYGRKGTVVLFRAEYVIMINFEFKQVSVQQYSASLLGIHIYIYIYIYT